MSENNITIRLETKDDYQSRGKPNPRVLLECLPSRLHGALCAALLSG